MNNYFVMVALIFSISYTNIICAITPTTNEQIIFPIAKEDKLNKALEEKNIFLERLATIIKQNGNYFIVADKENCRIHVFFLKNFSYKKSFGSKGQAPTQFNFIEDIYLTNKFIYIYDASARKIVSFDFEGNFKKIYKLKGPGRYFAVDERKKLFIISNTDKNNILFVSMKTGKLINYGSLPYLGNNLLDIQYFSLSHPIITDKYYIFSRIFYPELTVVNKKTMKTVKNINICPEKFGNRIEIINKILEKGLGEREGMINWGGDFFVGKNNVYILNSNYITILNLKTLKTKYYILAKKNNRNGFDLLSYSFFIMKGNDIYTYLFDDEESFYKFNIK